MKAWTSLNFNQIPALSPELSALARLKNCCEHSSAYIFDWIFFIFSGNEDNQRLDRVRNLARWALEMQSYSP